MVDRIVPATKPEDIEAAGAEDRLPGAWTPLRSIVHEPFRQWVVEDDFVPAYGDSGPPRT
jgi:fructuronate reductase